MPLSWKGRTYRFDFAFPSQLTILETNGRRWHEDPVDYEDDNGNGAFPDVTGTSLFLRPGTRSYGDPVSSSTNSGAHWPRERQLVRVRSSRFSTLPDGLRGSSSMNSTSLGTLNFASWPRQWSMSSSAVAVDDSARTT